MAPVQDCYRGHHWPRSPTATLTRGASASDNGAAMTRTLALFLLLSTSRALAADTVPTPALAALKPALRERIDRLALATPPQKTAEMSLDLSGDVAAWLLRHVALSDEEEQEAAAPVHARILAEHKDRIRP